jgi:hypothetical protein
MSKGVEQQRKLKLAIEFYLVDHPFQFARGVLQNRHAASRASDRQIRLIVRELRDTAGMKLCSYRLIVEEFNEPNVEKLSEVGCNLLPPPTEQEKQYFADTLAGVVRGIQMCEQIATERGLRLPRWHDRDGIAELLDRYEANWNRVAATIVDWFDDCRNGSEFDCKLTEADRIFLTQLAIT